MPKKKKRRRRSPQQKAIDLAEAKILGLPLPVPKLKYCTYVPDNARDLSVCFADYVIRAMGVDLGCYKKPGLLKGRPHALVLQDVLARLRLLTIDTAPSSIEGLVALGEHRVRYLVGLLVSAGYGPDHFLVAKGRKDLTFEELVPRVLRGLKDHDRRNGRRFVRRDPMPGPELFEPEPEPPAPPVSARTLRLFEKGRKHRHDPHKRISQNRSRLYRSRRCIRPSLVEGTLRCGCLVHRTVSDPAGHFSVWSVLTRCAGHAKEAVVSLHRGVLHERDLARVPRKRRRARDHQARGRPWRKAG